MFQSVTVVLQSLLVPQSVIHCKWMNHTKDEFLSFYDDEAEDRWEVANQTEPYRWGATNVDSILGRALWPREMPMTMMVVNGEILMAAAVCPPRLSSHTCSRHCCRTPARVRGASGGD